MLNINPNRLMRFSLVFVDLMLILFAYILSFVFAAQITLIEQRNIESFINLIPWILLISVFL
ncbi:hypothetical protein [Halalkalibacter okhensis]|uniref:hypothetical protein n=1 Tax=Halalkalibacter okhensis TaxID=333138 RepID=UPI00068C795E|nr:hypothetical protein [Halalkalibacter okhensis]